MRIEVAGAGAGKTTSMAARILSRDIPKGKVVYCVAFTNAAADNISGRIERACGSVPPNIRISTIHSFLYTELIQPYYHLLYGKHYLGVSVVKVSDNLKFHSARIRELDDDCLLHQTAIPQRAKWLVDKKTGDTSKIKKVRVSVLRLFASYCDGLFVDEAQDIAPDVEAILIALDHAGVEINLYGDPKQDVRGFGCFRELIKSCDSVNYVHECHRCPAPHILLSNTLANDCEQQVADAANRPGSINVYLETETDVRNLIESEDYGLVYISRKNKRFETHASASQGADLLFDSLFHEVCLAVIKKHRAEATDLEIRRATYYASKKMISSVSNGNDPRDVLKAWIGRQLFDDDKKTYARVLNALQPAAELVNTSAIHVSSIEAVKGLESERCLFILTSDLAPYLFGQKTQDNKMKHLLYVALTRSLDNLSILATEEVERVYSRDALKHLEQGRPIA